MESGMPHASWPLDDEGNYTFWLYGDPYKATIAKEDGSEVEEDVRVCRVASWRVLRVCVSHVSHCVFSVGRFSDFGCPQIYEAHNLSLYVSFV